MKKLIFSIIFCSISFLLSAQQTELSSTPNDIPVQPIALSDELFEMCLADPEITPELHTFYLSNYGFWLATNGGNREKCDSLINLAFKLEKERPKEKWQSIVFQGIINYRIFTGNKPGILETIPCYTYSVDNNGLPEGFDMFTYWTTLIMAFREGGDDETSRRMSSEIIIALGSNKDIQTTNSLLDLITQCYKTVSNDNKQDFNALMYCLALMTEHLNKYISQVGAENVNVSYMYTLLEIIRLPLLETYVNIEDVLKMSDTLIKIIENRDLTYLDRSLYVKFLSQHSQYLLAHGQRDEAVKYADKAISKAENDRDRLQAILAIMAICFKDKDLNRVEQLYPDFKKVAKSLGYQNNLMYRNIEASFEGLRCIKNNDIEGAAEWTIKQFNNIKEEWEQHVPFMSNADRENFITSYGDPAANMTNILELVPTKISGDVYNAILYRNGMQLRASKDIAESIKNSRNPEVKILNDSLTMIRKVFNNMPNQTQFTMQLDLRMRNLEYKISDLLRNEEANKTIIPSWIDLHNVLAPGEVAIEFIFCNTKIYALLLLPSNGIPVAVPLVNKKEFTDYLESFGLQSPVRVAQKLYAEGNSLPYQMLWQPLEKYLKGTHTIYLSVSGSLNSISFNALWLPTGEHLFDRYDIHQLTTTGEIINNNMKASFPQSALLLGDVSFSTEVGNLSDKDSSRGYDIDGIEENDLDSRGAVKSHFRSIPFSCNEINDIAALFPETNLTMLSGNEASEENLREKLKTAPGLIHLATHGFFIGDKETAVKIPFMRRHANTIASPLQRAGVALAGAEQTWRGESKVDEMDGILTALEIAELNLKGTELVTLSACETALGNVTFEGVFGLPRGFKQAGAKSLLVSLWSVNDKATSVFMTEFYRNWANGLTRHDSYRNAIKRVRADFPQPFHWAPFILLD